MRGIPRREIPPWFLVQCNQAFCPSNIEIPTANRESMVTRGSQSPDRSRHGDIAVFVRSVIVSACSILEASGAVFGALERFLLQEVRSQMALLRARQHTIYLLNPRRKPFPLPHDANIQHHSALSTAPAPAPAPTSTA